MKKSFFSFFMILCPMMLFAQSQELLDRIAVAYQVQQLSSDNQWDQVIAIGKKIPVRDSLYSYSINNTIAKAYLHKRDTVNAMKKLKQAIMQQELESIGQINYQYRDFHLDSNRLFQDIVKNLDQLNDHFSSQLNGKMMRDCLEIFYTDQRLRNIWWPYMRDSTIGKKLELAMDMSDSMNIKSMKQILRTYGRYPGISDLGPSFSNMFNIIIGHMVAALDRDTLYNYLRTATLNGQIHGSSAAFLLDKIEVRYGRPLLYGEQGTSANYIDGVYHYSEVQDVEHLDKRRAEFLLPPIYRQVERNKSVPPPGYDHATQKN